MSDGRSEDAPRESDARHAYLLKLADRLRLFDEPLAIEKAATELLAEHLDAARSYYTEIDDERNTGTIRAVTIRQPAPDFVGVHDLTSWSGPIATLRAGKPVVVDDWGDVDVSEQVTAALAKLRIRSQIAVPLVRDGRLVAALSLNDTRPRHWTEADVSLVLETAERTWEAVQRARAEAALRASEEKYRSLVETMSEGYLLGELVRDAEGRVVDARLLEMNAAWERLVGSRRTDAVGKLRSDAIAAPSAHGLRHATQAIVEQRAVHYEAYYPSLDRWYEGRVYPRGGDVFASFYDDISERKRADTVLRENERQNRFLLTVADRLSALSDPDALRDAATQLLREHLDSSHCCLVEWEVEQGKVLPLALGEPLIVEDWLERPLSDAAREQLAFAQSRAQVTIPLAKNGKLTAVLTVADLRPRKWTGPELAVITDTAQRTWAAIERARAEAALRDADRRKDAFIATLSHELRNPLAALRSASSVLADGRASDLERLEAAAIVQRQATMMSRLLDDLLDTTRIDLGLLTIDKRVVTVASIVEEALEAAQPLLDAAHHAVSVTIRPRTLAVDADPTRIAQVLANLVTNAAKYTEDSGRIAIEAAIEGSDVVIRVIDNGTGLAAEDLGHLFDMFSQGGNAVERGKGGVGIGLALARRILDLHGGWVRAESAGRGEGSTFIVGLPRLPQDTAIPALRARPRSGEVRRPSSARLLIADDTRDIIDPLALLLRARGYETTTATDGAAALAQAERVHPQVVVLDLGMPRLDGYEVARRIRATDWGARALLIALTGWGRAEDKLRVREAGFDAHLTKGSDPAELFALIDEHAAKS